MKKIKLSLMAVAFLLATGAAFATKTHNTTDCGGNPNTDPTICSPDNVPCCTYLGMSYNGDFNPKP